MNNYYGITKRLFWGYVFVTIISVQYSLINTDFEITGLASTLIMVIEIIVFSMYLFDRKYNIKTLVLLFLLLTIAIITYYITGATTFLIMLITAIVFESLDYHRAFQLIFIIRLVMMLFIIMCALVGVLNLYEWAVIKSGNNAVMGYGLGFTHPNRLAYVFEFLILLFVCYKNREIKRIHYFGIMCFVLLGYSLTKSRTLLFSIISMLVLIVLYKSRLFHKFIKFLLDKFSILIMPICATISIVIPLLMITATGGLQIVLYAINGMFSSRFTHIYRAFLNYPITLFGGINDFSILQDIYQYSTVDNGYIRLLYGFGIIGFGLFIVFNFITMKKLIKKGEYIYIIVCIIISIWGMSENILGSFAFNFSVAFWSELLKDNQKLKRKID